MTDIVDRLIGEKCDYDARCYAASEIAILRLEKQKLRAALDTVMIGGNHLVSIIGVTHPQAGTHHDAALEFYGPGHQYDVWCCWNAIMLARAALAQGGDNAE